MHYSPLAPNRLSSVGLILVFMIVLSSCGLLGPAVGEAPTPTADLSADPERPSKPTASAAAGEAEPGTADESAPDAADLSPPELPDTPGGTLILTLGVQDPPAMDPALVGDVLSAFVVRQLFSGLVRLDNNLEIQPDLAASWELSEDGRTYTFTLDPNARFADGTPVTAETVQYSLERAADPTLAPVLPAQTYLIDIVGVREKLTGQANEISGIEVIDERTIAITIDQPKGYFLSKLAHPTSFIVDPATVEGSGPDWIERPNGSGPFEIEQWRRNELLVLRRNLNFYRDIARLDRVSFLIGAAASNPLVLYEQGEIDATSVPSFALNRVKDESNPLSEELVSVPQLSLTYVGLNLEEPPFDDPKVRQAFNLLLDRQRLAEVTLYGSVEPARGILPPGIPGYNPQLAEQPVPAADIDQVLELLADSSYGGIESLPAIVAYGGGFTGTIAALAEEELGIEIELRSYESFGTFLSEIDEDRFPMFGLGWVGDYPDPENFLDVLFRTDSPENHMNYSNPEVDALLDEAAVETDEARRWELYREAEQLILEDVPLIPISHDVEHMLIKPYVRGLEVTPMGLLDLSTVELVR